MSAKKLDLLDVEGRRQWRNWLQEHHASHCRIWLVFHKEQVSLGYDDAVEEALCFGWIDSLIRRLDDERYARLFTPRKAGSKWSTINRRRYADLEARGLLAAPGLRRQPTSRNGDAPRPSLDSIPPYIERELKATAHVWSFFQQLAPSCQRAYIGWIDSAKREETKQKRLHEAVGMLAAGKKLGLK